MGNLTVCSLSEDILFQKEMFQKKEYLWGKCTRSWSLKFPCVAQLGKDEFYGEITSGEVCAYFIYAPCKLWIFISEYQYSSAGLILLYLRAIKYILVYTGLKLALPVFLEGSPQNVIIFFCASFSWYSNIHEDCLFWKECRVASLGAVFWVCVSG